MTRWLATGCLVLGLAAGARAEEAPAPSSGPTVGMSGKGPHHVYLVGNLLVTEPRLVFDPETPDRASAMFTIGNRGPGPDRLVSATTERADRVVLDANGAAPGSDAGGLVIPPGKTIAVGQEGAHVVLEGLHGDVRPAGTIPGVLSFERAGPLHMTFETGEAPPPP